MANFCPNCGNKLNSGAKFCSACGQSISESAGERVGDNTVAPNNTTTQNPNNFTEPQQYVEGHQIATQVNQITAQGIIERFFKSDGRLNRKAFNLRLLAIYVVRYILVSIVAYFLSDGAGNFTEGRAIIVMLFSCIFIYSNYCINVRREQDLSHELVAEESEEDKKKEKTLLSDVIAVFDAVLLIVAFWPNMPTSGKGLLLLKWHSFIALAVFLGQFYLMVRKGVTGPNRYGPDPLQK